MEVYNEDIDIARLFTECRVGGSQCAAAGYRHEHYRLQFHRPRYGNLRNHRCAVLSLRPRLSRQPGFWPASQWSCCELAVTTVVAVVTAMNIQNTITMTADAVVGSNISPEIFAGRNVITGQMTAFFYDSTHDQGFRQRDPRLIFSPISPLSSAPGSPAMSFYLPPG